MFFFVDRKFAKSADLYKIRILTCSVVFATVLLFQPSLEKKYSFIPTAEAQVTPIDNFDIFNPTPANNSKLDYSIWNDALAQVVLDFGPSTRLRASRPSAAIGSRFIRGHKSAYRLEGSRFTFEFITDDYRKGLSNYRLDLQDIATDYDITRFPKNEQLAFWINLHNVAVLEKIAENYPVQRPEKIKLKVEGKKYKFHEAPFIQVMGQSISLADIRKNIVCKNWDDDSVIYGFFRGDIGSPSLQSYAFTGENTEMQLNQNADDFVNSLRGFNLGWSTRNISAIYQEAAPYYFRSWETDLDAHLRKFANEKVKAELAKPYPFKIDIYDSMIADISGGERLGSSGAPTSNQGLSFETRRLLDEVQTKREYLRRRDLIHDKKGFVIIEDLVPDEDK